MQLRVFAVLIVVVASGVAAYRSYCPPEVAPQVKERPKFWNDPAFVQALAASGKLGTKGMVIVAPASGVSDEGAERAYSIARDLGVRLPETALKFGAVPYNANDDEVRLALLREALDDPEIEVIWALRGGYGSSRLLPALSDMPEPSSPKIFIGYSDMTFLHLFLQRWNWRTVHGAMLLEVIGAGEGKDEDNFRLLAALLSGKEKELRYGGLVPLNQPARDLAGSIDAPVFGGNLTCLAAAAGTPWALKGEGRILFFEDQREPGYKIDRMLTQLKDSGALEGVKAVIFGEFSEGDEKTGYALERFAGSVAVPVFSTDQFGHGKKNFPLIFNSPAAIEKETGDAGLFSLRIEAGLLP